MDVVDEDQGAGKSAKKTGHGLKVSLSKELEVSVLVFKIKRGTSSI